MILKSLVKNMVTSTKLFGVSTSNGGKNMKMKQIIYVMLIVSLIMGCVGCAGTSGKTNGKNLTIWAETSTTKILQDDDGEAVKTAKDKSVMRIHMAKNEAEGAQLMMYAKQDISDYTVSISDLKCGDDKIEAETIDIYMLKYQTVEMLQSTPNTAFPPGSRVPDPMLPMATAIEYEENSVAKGENQAIYFDVPTNNDTEAGVYSGFVSVKTGRETYKLPIEVTVYDVELPDTPGLKTAFTYYGRDFFAGAELDASDEMTTTYFETLMKYNMGSYLPFEGEGGTEKYLELLKKYYDYPGFTSYRLYYDTSGAVYEGVECNYNVPLLKEYVRAIAEMSVKDQVNYLDKAYCYFYTVADEPNSEEDFKTAKAALDVYTEMLADCDAELKYKYFGTPEYEYYVSNISKAVLGIPNVLPGSLFTEELEKYELSELTMIPQIEQLHSDASRKRAREGREDKQLWTYTCNFPVYPYPTSHVDDYNLGFRLTSWMCSEYDWDGFLQWRSVGYTHRMGGVPITDPWEVVNTTAGRPGEGIYLYPGEKYGLDEPCPSIRAIIYRDGTEDYEVLKYVEKIYEEYGLDATYALEELYSQVYSGTIPTTDSYLFESVRCQLFDSIVDLCSNVGILYENVEVGFDSAEVVFRTVHEEATVKVDGKNVNADENGSYHVAIDLKKQDKCNIQITFGKETKEYIKHVSDGLVGTICGFENGEKVDDYIAYSKKATEANVNQDAQYVIDGEKSLHLTLNQAAEDVIPYFGIEKNNELINGSWDKIASFKFSVYNSSSEDINIDVTYYASTEVLMDTYLLKAGEWTMIEVGMPADVENLDDIQEFDFNFERGSTVDLYIDNLVAIVRGE